MYLKLFHNIESSYPTIVIMDRIDRYIIMIEGMQCLKMYKQCN